jgi:transposase-like protein
VSRGVLIVAGVNDDGRREILTWRVAEKESEETWLEVLGELKRRGLGGVELVVSDGHEGIRAAAERMFPDAAWQRCRVHFIRNALNKVSYRDQKALAKELRALFRLTDGDLCRQVAGEIADRWGEKYPRLARQIEDQFEQCLAILSFPSNHRRRLHSTNMLERLMREVKRRTRVVGIFPNDAACDRLVGAILLEYHDTWQCERARYVGEVRY